MHLNDRIEHLFARWKDDEFHYRIRNLLFHNNYSLRKLINFSKLTNKILVLLY